MGPVHLGVGTEWLLDERAYRVVRQPSPDQFIAVDLKFNVEREFARAEILSRYAKGELTFATPENAPPRSPKQPPQQQDIRDLTEEEQQGLQRRWEALEPLTPLGRQPTWQDFSLRAEQLKATGQLRSADTLRRYWIAWHRSSGSRSRWKACYLPSCTGMRSTPLRPGCRWMPTEWYPAKRSSGACLLLPRGSGSEGRPDRNDP
jgi:hypothetical protein